jgi:hypothetical protein
MRTLRILSIIIAFGSLVGILFSSIPKLFSALYLLSGAAFSFLSILIEKKDESISISHTISSIKNRSPREGKQETKFKS